MREKEFLNLNPLPADLCADKEIRRIGGPPHFSSEIHDRISFCQEMAEAMQADAQNAEARNPGKLNIVLCGGKDSLNLLLLPWKNPVVVYSAEPNLPLVRDFVKNNCLDLDVFELVDKEEPALRDREIAESFCSADLSQWKWTAHLCEIAEENQRNVIFWKGQVADAFLTDYWRSYTYRRSYAFKKTLKVLQRAARVFPTIVDSMLGDILIREFEKSLWLRAAVNQGFHMGFLRSITDTLVLSGYHGPRTANVWQKLDLRCLAGDDLRLEIGRLLHGREVHYPRDNPAPESSYFRKDYRNPHYFLASLEKFGIVVQPPTR